MDKDKQRVFAEFLQHERVCHPAEVPPAESKVEELMDVLAKSVDAAEAARKAATATRGDR